MTTQLFSDETAVDEPLLDLSGPDTTDAAAPPADPEAPYGRDSKGKAYKRSPEWRAAQSERMRRAQGATTDKLAEDLKPKRPSAGRSRSDKATPAEYTMAAAGMLQLPAFALMLASKFMPSLRYDAEALTLHTPTLAQAIGRAATQDDWIRNLLEKSMQVGPRGELVVAFLPFLMQVGVNHKWLQPSPEAGTIPADGLAEALERMTTGGSPNGKAT